MKVISRRTIRAICKIPPEKLAEKKIIVPARHGGYCCPMPDCGNGTGHDGTGITPTFNEKKNYWHWWCPKCGKNFNNLSVFKAHYKIDDFNELAESICADFDISPEYEEKDSPRFSRTRRTKTATNEEKISPEELKMIRADLNAPIDPLKRFLQFGCDNNLWRGLPLEFLLKFNVRFVHYWVHPKSRIANSNASASPRMLIPCSDSSYLARLTCPLEEFDEQTRPFIHEKEHTGRKTIFNAADLDSGEIIFVVEGYIDCMSVVYAGYRCVALGGAKEMAKLVDAVAKMPNKPRIIALLDSDDTGRKNAPILVDDLITVGCPAVARFLSEENCKVDCNQILDEQGVDELREILAEIHDDAASELAAVAQIIEERKAARVAAKVDELFQNKGTQDDDFADRLKIFCGDEIRWLRDDKSWLTFERNGYGGGKWHDGGAENSAVMPHARKMADVMNTYAENSDEKEIAEKFKSTKKKMQTITALKGVDDIIITADDIKQHAELLNVRNGIVDLTSGELLPAAPELLMTQTAAAVYNPKCTDMTFAEFFKSVLPDEETRAAILRYLGYTLTADVREEKFLMIHGRGGNGKGCMLLCLRVLLGDYCCELPVDTVIESKSKFADANGRATTELTPLVNRRLGIVDELPRNSRFDVAKVNRLTGRDCLPIRKLHHEYYDVPPTHKLILTGNFRPQIDDPRDVALLRRLIVVNFGVDFSQNPDVTLKDKLLADSALTGALNILVNAAVDWYRDGLLQPSPLMNHAREEFLGENDFIGDFLAEYYEFGTGKDFTISRKELLKHLRAKCADAARYRDSDLCNMLAKVDGVTYTKAAHNVNIFYGIKRATKQDEQQGDDNEIFADGEIVSSADFIPPPN